MNGCNACAKLQKSKTPNAQRPTPNIELKHVSSKKRSMMISIFRQRWDSCLNRFAKRIARWMKKNWTLPPQARGWLGGNGSTRFSLSKRRLKSSFHRKWRSSPRIARTHGARKIGNAAMTCASKFPPTAGKCATLRTAQNSRGAAPRDLGSIRVPRVGFGVAPKPTFVLPGSALNCPARKSSRSRGRARYPEKCARNRALDSPS